MSLQTYRLLVAPGVLCGLSLIGWIALRVTRHREPKADIAIERP